MKRRPDGSINLVEVEDFTGNEAFLAARPEDRTRLEVVISHRASPQKHVWRCRIVLLSGDGLGTMAIVTATGKTKKCVWRWQDRFMQEGVDGLLRE